MDKNVKKKNIAILVALLAFVALLFFVTLARLSHG
jgi:hypothetical protein